MLDPAEYYQLVRDTFQDKGDPEIALFQMAYLKHQFEFFGLKMPQWMAITRTLHQQEGVPQGSDLLRLVRMCFEDDHREMHYFALETLQVVVKKQRPDAEFIDFLEELILSRSWWDTVDWINKLVGQHFIRYPELIRPVTERWMDSGQLWLQRICLIFQLTYREKTDSALLFEYVLRVAGSKEFFLQKGAGWALRQYSKTHPQAVRHFVAQHRLPALTRREALRLMDQQPDRPAFR